VGVGGGTEVVWRILVPVGIPMLVGWDGDTDETDDVGG